MLLDLYGSDLFYCCFNLRLACWLSGLDAAAGLIFVFCFSKVLFLKTQMGNFQRREEKAYHVQQRWPWHMDGSFSKGCSGATSRCPTVSPHHLALGQRAEVNGCQQIKIGTRWACNHPKCCESSFKGPCTFPKQTLLPFWFCYESR